jgi:two-component system, OmpR family, response regulator ChvI
MIVPILQEGGGWGEMRRILVVDDEPDVIITLRLGLEDTGLFEVYPFTSPELALQNFKSGFYDLLLIDMIMPRMNGYELYDKMKGIDNKVKACFISAYEINYDALRERFPSLEMECHIKKPIRIDDLVMRINEELERKK